MAAARKRHIKDLSQGKEQTCCKTCCKTMKFVKERSFHRAPMLKGAAGKELAEMIEEGYGEMQWVSGWQCDDVSPLHVEEMEAAVRYFGDRSGLLVPPWSWRTLTSRLRASQVNDVESSSSNGVGREVWVESFVLTKLCPGQCVGINVFSFLDSSFGTWTAASTKLFVSSV